jgi:hypothetical protein
MRASHRRGGGQRGARQRRSAPSNVSEFLRMGIRASRTPEFSCNVLVAGKPRIEPKLHRHRARRDAPRAGPPPQSSTTSRRAYAKSAPAHPHRQTAHPSSGHRPQTHHTQSTTAPVGKATGRGHVDDALTRTGTARGQRGYTLPTARAFAHMPTASHHGQIKGPNPMAMPLRIAPPAVRITRSRTAACTVR